MRDLESNFDSEQIWGLASQILPPFLSVNYKIKFDRALAQLVKFAGRKARQIKEARRKLTSRACHAGKKLKFERSNLEIFYHPFCF
ncbi:hypothetical protein [Campylobacter showae]|uniref:Uncharacterized protein n=1 Tax=Campylobacter showae CC57C TaxID=1073353 RepID=M3ILU6_9BACT|nr:hypothetical protein [Campylobacter showae]EMG31101.1 hypothetical protein H740_03017 [Campylobacter showae CC57C]